jgi:hypothetical protein
MVALDLLSDPNRVAAAKAEFTKNNR